MAEKKKIHKLKFELENDSYLIGIASHENDYRLSWALNKNLDLKLVKVDDLIVNHPNLKLKLRFQCILLMMKWSI